MQGKVSSFGTGILGLFSYCKGNSFFLAREYYAYTNTARDIPSFGPGNNRYEIIKAKLDARKYDFFRAEDIKRIRPIL